MTVTAMAWPTSQDLKDYLRIQTTAEDSVIDDLNSAAIAAIVGYVDRQIDAAEMVMEDRAETLNAYSAVRRLCTTDWPVSMDPVPVITDREGATVDPTTYSWLPIIGLVRANRGIYFASGPYEITATVGQVFVPDFALRVQPLLRRAVLDLGAVFYQQRNANASQESEAGVSASWHKDEIPPRICAMIANLRRPSQRIGQRVS
jgi:hypothetical protein